jgi:hypothetical protein
MSELIRIVAERGDLAHVALLGWALSAIAACALLLRELSAAARRFDDFVRVLQVFNRRGRALRPIDEAADDPPRD